MTLPAPVPVLTGQAITATGQSAAFNTSGDLDLEVEVTAVSGTSPSITFSVQFSMDGTNWAAPATADSFTAITAVGNAIAGFPALAPFWRLAWTVSGTSPHFTVTVYQSDQ